METKSIRIIVKGRVQGVGFRHFVYRQAEKLNLTGYAENLYNGDVQVVAQGEEGMLDELVKALRVGPRFASVSNVQAEPIELKEDYPGFYIR
jgi:acylphosphatase